ncbi:MAG: hypothetical protein ABFS41_19525, partial [Myxococcota bacterium]
MSGSELRGAARFVGRDACLQTLDASVDGGGPRAVWLSGPGGIGKSALLHAFGERCRQREVSVAYLDAWRIEPSRVGLMSAIAPGPEHAPDVILLDNLEALDDSLRSWLIAQLSGDLAERCLVMASRSPPLASLLVAPGMPDRLAHIGLEALDDVESAELLEMLDVPEGLRRSLNNLACGHPLTLTLAAELEDLGEFVDTGFEAAPTLVRALIRSLLPETRSAAERTALAVLAIAHRTTGGLLRRFVGAGADEIFDRLRGRSYTSVDRDGLYPHDIVRQAVLAELRWRDRKRWTELQSAVRSACLEELAELRSPAAVRNVTWFLGQS